MKDFMQQDKQYIIVMAIQMFWHFQRKAGTAYEKENIISDIGGGTLYINAFILMKFVRLKKQNMLLQH